MHRYRFPSCRRLRAEAGQQLPGANARRAIGAESLWALQPAMPTRGVAPPRGPPGTVLPASTTLPPTAANLSSIRVSDEQRRDDIPVLSVTDRLRRLVAGYGLNVNHCARSGVYGGRLPLLREQENNRYDDGHGNSGHA
jgi:hypothetical protein